MGTGSGALMGAGGLLAVLGIFAGNAPAKTEKAPEPKVIERIVEVDKAGRCMSLQEQGTVIGVKVGSYGYPAEEKKEGTREVSTVSFKMKNGYSRVCEYDELSLTEVLQPGMVINARGGKRVM